MLGRLNNAPAGQCVARGVSLWSDAIGENTARRSPQTGGRVIGVLPGEGIGPDVVACALRVLSAVESEGGQLCQVRFGGAIGRDAERRCGAALSGEVIEFCAEVFAEDGAILAGAGGGRFVYDLRKHFDLFCKFSPLKVSDELVDAGRMKPEFVRGVDLLVVRENSSGIYQGQWSESTSSETGRLARHSFSYSEPEVRRILEVGARVARMRRREMAVVYKDSGIPTISALWRDTAAAVASAAGVRSTMLDVDHAAFRLLQHAHELDVIVAPNLFGDVLSDLGAVLLGCRGLTYSGNFAADGAAVYQTNHGAAYDLSGTDQANPAGQILALAMLLRESFGFVREAHLIESALAAVWHDGWRTAGLMEKGCRLAGTRQMGELCAEAVLRLWGAERDS
jgi:3-isopropylmalate dehydrogenase